MLLCVLKEKTTYITKIAVASRCTYSHAIKIVGELEKKGLLKLAKEGRVKKAVLTEKGKRIAVLLRDLEKELRV